MSLSGDASLEKMAATAIVCVYMCSIEPRKVLMVQSRVPLSANAMCWHYIISANTGSPSSIPVVLMLPDPS